MMLFITHIIFILIILVTFSANDLISESCHYTQGQSSGCQTVSMIVVPHSQPRSQPYEPAEQRCEGGEAQHYRAVRKYCAGGKNLEWSREVFVR